MKRQDAGNVLAYVTDSEGVEKALELRLLASLDGVMELS